MLAAVRRGPLATPDEFEKIEYLFTRVKKGQAVWRFDRFALEHTLSYQRRVHAIKTNFMVRQQPTPLGTGGEQIYTTTHTGTQNELGRGGVGVYGGILFIEVSSSTTGTGPRASSGGGCMRMCWSG